MGRPGPLDGCGLAINIFLRLQRSSLTLSFLFAHTKVVSIDNDMARSMASERVGFGTQSLLEKWRDSYGNGDYDEDPYDDDIYEGHDLSQEL
ncbi:hypothetical protein Tco_0547889 [Tanacetum coccineum]